MFCLIDATTIRLMLAEVTTEGWQPGMTGPQITGSLIVASYLIVAAGCAWALRVARIGAQIAERYRIKDRRARGRSSAYRASFLFWAMLTLWFVILGLNKRFDLETWLTEFGRQIALEHGWYDGRWQLQEMLVIGIVLGSVSVLATLLCLTRSLLPRHVLAFVGTALLGCFVLARTLSFHHLDDILAIELLGLRLRSLAELTGIICVGVCAVMNCWWYHTTQLPPASTEAGQHKIIGH